jgi:hypothetical protein
MKKYLTGLCLLSFFNVYANNSANVTESDVLAEYNGVVGDAPARQTVSNAGAAIEFMSNASQYYGYFAQTLSSGVYYEIRLYTRDNYMASNPLVAVPISDINNPWGYGVSGKLGYNFHISEDAEITPYIRLNAYNNMGPVYADSDGDYINSKTFSYLVGTKLALRVAPKFTPYIDIYGGYQTNNLQGAFPNGPIGNSQQINGNLNQWVITYEIGAAAKFSDHISVIPYWQYITQQNNPDQTALNTINQGGFGITPFTGTQQVYGLKLNVVW